ncbi:MAG: DUF460 domain-containing protein [Candidatus Heimdallarchaeota archaeon]|nr:DUF460 domain-containing protein [Candidatus Heimdallarchaeota archaeon]
MKVINISKEDSDFIIIGVDILPQSIPSTSTHYSVCVYDGNKGEIIKKYAKANLSKIIGLAQSSQASYVATDNIYELVRNPSQIPKLCVQLLPKTKIVQVTGSPVHGFTSLLKLMKQNGIPIPNKLTPMAAAEACSVLSSKKLGYIIEPFEDETKIIVSRSRAKGPGGWSQKRYSRLMDTSVDQEAKNIESQLIELRLDYDKKVARSKFGAKKVVFSVYALISEVTKAFRKRRGELCQVQIHPVNKERVEFIPLSQQVQIKSSLRRLIVGLDPGLTIGLSIMDLNGKILKVASFREASRGQIIRAITQYGKPTLICVDVYPYPAYVEKVAAALNARTYTPRSVMTVSEKNEISRKLAMQHGVLVKNAHQRDSLASAYKGYTKFKGEFEKIDRKYYSQYDRSIRDEIKDLIVKGKTPIDAEDIISKSLRKNMIELPKEVIEKTLAQEISKEDLDSKIKMLQEHLDWERRKNSELYIEYQTLEEKVEYLETRLQEGKSEYMESMQREKTFLVKENEISFLRDKVSNLEQELDRYGKRVEELKKVSLLRGNEGWVPLKVIRKFSYEEIEKTARNYGLGPGDIVLILDSSGGGGKTADQLLSYRIKGIIGNVNHLSYNAKLRFFEEEILMADPAEVEIIRIDEIAVIKEEDLLKVLERAKKELDVKIVEKKKGILDNLLDEYRDERKKEIEEYDERLQNKRTRSSAPYEKEDTEDEFN